MTAAGSASPADSGSPADPGPLAGSPPQGGAAEGAARGAEGYAGRSKYDPARAARYAARSARRHAEEWALLARVLETIPPPATVLDAPCGAGRVARELLARGARVRAADLSPSMLAHAREAVGAHPQCLGVEVLDLEAPVPAGAPTHELVVCFRFLHHLPDAATRARVLASLAARSSRHVLVSFHHPASVHQVARGLRRLLTRRRGDRHAITLGALAREAAPHGLRLRSSDALGRYRRDLWVALFDTSPRTAGPSRAG